MFTLSMLPHLRGRFPSPLSSDTQPLDRLATFDEAAALASKLGHKLRVLEEKGDYLCDQQCSATSPEQRELIVGLRLANTIELLRLQDADVDEEMARATSTVHQIAILQDNDSFLYRQSLSARDPPDERVIKIVRDRGRRNMIQIADLKIVAIDEELVGASTVAQKLSILRLMRDALAHRLRYAETATLRECFKDRLTANCISILELEAAAVDEQQLGDAGARLAEQHRILDECWFLARGSSRTWFSSGTMAHLNRHLPVAPNNVVKAERLYQRLIAAWMLDDGEKELFGLSCCCAPWFGWAEADDDDDNAQWTSPSALWSSIVSAWCGASSTAEEDDTPPPADSVSVGGGTEQKHSSASRAGLRRRRM